MSQTEVLIATCKGLGIKVDPNVFEVVDGVLTLKEGVVSGSGEKGDTGVGIKDITGNIDGSNVLTLTITLTDETQKQIKGTITPQG